MAEYIEREAALEAIDEYFRTTNPDGDEQIGVLRSRRIIRTLPSAYVAPVLQMGMAELIDRDALKEALLERGFYPDIVEVVLESAPSIETTCVGCKWENRKRPQKCSCCRRNKHMKDSYEVK